MEQPRRALRGKVRRARRGAWTWKVYDGGAVIAHGQEFSEEGAFEVCHQAVQAARDWWMYGTPARKTQ
jgi:hypothetical protein